MQDYEVPKLMNNLREELMKAMLKAVESTKVKEIVKELEKRGINFKPRSIEGNLLSQKQVEQSFQDLPPDAKETLGELESRIDEMIKEGLEGPEIVDKMKELKKYGIEIKGYGLQLTFIFHKEIFGTLELSEDDKELLKKWGVSW